jgi:hypothetical protein
MQKTEIGMVMQCSIKAFTLAGTLALALAGNAQARDRLSEKNCPTGQIENRITAICEGRFAGSFIFVSPADGDNWRGHHHWHHWHHWRRHHHWHHHW